MYKAYSKLSLPALLVLAALALSSCVSSPPGVAQLQDLISKSCFEVVIPRIERADIAYERDLPWSSLPYNERNDTFFSIGTAFAVAPDRFVTAAHVLSPGDYSWVSNEYYIRDAQGGVYRVDNVVAFDTAKDYAVFTVEGFTAPATLTIDQNYSRGQKVYQVGNIYGQGIVAVPGTILEEFKEERDGRWVYIKSSPPNDKGSSGGPLLDEKFNVIGIIDMKDNTFAYSLPMSLVQLESDAGVIEQRMQYGFLLMPEAKGPVAYFDTTIPLPAKLADIKEEARSRYETVYRQSMEAFFKSHGGLFPAGAGSAGSLRNSTSSPGIQVVFRRDSDGEWRISELEKENANLYGGASLSVANVSGFNFIDLRVPAEGWGKDGVMSSNQRIMDTLLAGLAYHRNMGGEKIRMLSFGKPLMTERHVDAYGREWNLVTWTIDFGYSLAMLMWTPTPAGAACIFSLEDGNSYDWLSYDMKRVADLCYVPYSATLENWVGYLASGQKLYGDMEGMTVSYDDTGVSVDSSAVSLKLGADAFTVEDDNFLGLPYWFTVGKNGELGWKLRKVEYSQADDKAYFVSYLHMKPAADADKAQLRDWETIASASAPYDRIPVAKDGRRDIGGLHPSFNADNGAGFTIYVGVTGSPSDEELAAKLAAVESGLIFK